VRAFKDTHTHIISLKHKDQRLLCAHT